MDVPGRLRAHLDIMQVFRSLGLVASLAFASLPAAADHVTSATIGLNYIGKGQCTVINGGMADADATISIVDAATGAVLMGGGAPVTISAGASVLMEYQATTANRQDVYCQVVPVDPASELRMALKRVMFTGDVTDVSDGLPADKEVQKTEDVDNPAFQPVQMQASQFTEINNVTALFTGAHTDPVPPGKRLVVQHASLRVTSVSLEGDPVCDFVVRVADPFEEIIAHPVPTELEFTGVRDRAVVSMPITLYAEAGNEVGATCSVRVSEDTNLEVAVTGYFIDIDP